MPSPGFRGVDPVRVTVPPSVFDVRVQGSQAEAIRLNVEYAPRMGPIGPRAVLAIEQVSGCTVRRQGGDQAMIRASLNCGGRKAKPRLTSPSYSCGVITRPVSGGPGSRIEEIICDPQ
ncbi:hypothetical protein M8744_13100 [Lutimaribacter sp. EGI FJ00013]|uniref:Uncharacterized protein n=1 Tax=Lutimaribacter degradans TaxID=2945989 RepID=A0ACC5ZYE0_9RHOB|nr:hypothetical protein [Lutimaribacter sp. EGI FJ00013]MCM2563086.1 hypothetical protein [Lutimaribacter sp. EGI FJ00013]